MLECAIFGFKRFFDLQIEFNSKTDIMPQMEIKRAFSSVVLIWNELKNCKDTFKFSQWGTMLQEHFHGTVRGMSHGIDTLDNTINSIVRSNIIYGITNKQKAQLNCKTRYSVGELIVIALKMKNVKNIYLKSNHH